MEISICSKTSISDHNLPQEKGGVWLVIEVNDQRYIHHLSPEDLTSWVEGESIRNIADGLSGLPEIYLEEAYDKFDAELHRVVR